MFNFSFSWAISFLHSHINLSITTMHSPAIALEIDHCAYAIARKQQTKNGSSSIMPSTKKCNGRKKRKSCKVKSEIEWIFLRAPLRDNEEENEFPRSWSITLEKESDCIWSASWGNKRQQSCCLFLPLLFSNCFRTAGEFSSIVSSSFSTRFLLASFISLGGRIFSSLRLFSRSLSSNI